ncbi:MAG: glycosyl transferase [Desulfobulbaceae bacterium S3730MH12]|nr:MAG: glycosyl transferase [Desulfobulbaceae bacterium S5133MH15]OEU54015.1 MAG: glycosyl transferase [Desulfobulbaceae bacterium S3730MH12]OEU81658.1 MAG: glycosyl transferase [Desulfobulbaceae bacterium C00003063]
MPVSKTIFFFSLFMIFYVYLGYPVLVFLIGMIRNKKVERGDYEPHVTLLIAAHNEDESIESTLKNKLSLDYPKDKLEIIVISDGSTDRTDDIVKQYTKQGVRLLRQEPRAGKTAALNMAVRQANGEILVFSDANSIYAQDALRMLTQNFNDSTVGYATGKMIYTNQDGTAIGDGCTTYMKYENFLRYQETRVGSVVGVDGGIDACRRSLYQPMNPDQLPDFVLPLKVVEQSYRVVYEPAAILKEPSLKAPKDEYRMRVRVSLRALWALWDMRCLFTLTRSKLFAWQLLSHKVLRYLCFIFLIAAYLTNLVLWPESGLYKVLFILQNMAYLGAIVSPILEKRGISSRLLYMLSYFILLNLAAAHASIKFLLGQKQVMWTPRKG